MTVQAQAAAVRVGVDIVTPGPDNTGFKGGFKAIGGLEGAVGKGLPLAELRLCGGILTITWRGLCREALPGGGGVSG